MILEYKSPAALIFRLAGTACAEKFGKEITGLNLFDAFGNGMRNCAGPHFESVRSLPCGLLILEKMQSRYQSTVISEMIFLPLRTGDGEITQLIGSITAAASADAGNIAQDLQAKTKPASQFLDLGAGVPQTGAQEIRLAG